MSNIDMLERQQLTTAREAVDGPAVDTDAAPTIIQARQGLLLPELEEMWHYRELLFFLVWRDIKVRYKQTILGAGWAIIQPLFTMVIFSVIFGNFAKIPSEGVPYPIFSFAALLPWMFFQGAVSQAGVSLIAQSNLLTKIYFPRIFVPASTVGVALMDFALAFLVYLGIMVYYMHFPGLSILLLPVLLLVTTIAAMGVGLFMAAVTVEYRDFRHLVPFMLQVWMYASPVIYPVTMVPGRYQWLMGLNPMTGLIGAFRSVLLNRPIPWTLLGISSAAAVAIFVLGLWNFRRMERRFADVA